jgi:hypothetical protein
MAKLYDKVTFFLWPLSICTAQDVNHVQILIISVPATNIFTAQPGFDEFSGFSFFSNQAVTGRLKCQAKDKGRHLYFRDRML